MRNLYTVLGRTAHKTHETERSLGSSFGKVTIALLMFCFATLKLNAQSFATIGTGTNSTTSTGSDPIDGYFNSFRYQVVYTAAELTAAGMPANAAISGLGFSINGDYGGGNLIGYKINMAHTTATNCASHNATALTQVKTAFAYNPTATAAGAFDMITFDNNFIWNGTSNILVDICSDGPNAYVSPYGRVRTIAATTTNGSIYRRADGAGSQCGVNTNTINSNKPQIRFAWTASSACTGTPTPGNTLSSSPTVAPGGTVNLSLSTPPTGTGLTYQWQSAPTSGGTWTDIGGATAATYTATVTANTWYRCNVTCGGNTGTSTASQVSLTYCTPSSSSVDGTGITNVTFGTGPTVNNTTSNEANNYGNYSAQIGGLAQSSVATVSITYNTGIYPYNTGIYIDWNNDFDFADAGETVWTGVSGSNSPNTLTATFTVPATATISANYRMRIGGDDSGVVPAACATGLTYACFEDYTVTVLAPPACTAPSGLTSSTITATGATISWTAASPAPASGYEYYFSTSATAPTAGTAASGTTAASATTVTLTGLSGVTTYYFWVRSNCGGTGTSSWSASANFTTLCGLNTVVLNMADAWGDGWNGATYTLVNNTTSTTVSTGTLSTGATGSATFCVANGCYQFTTSDDIFDEMSWSLTVNGAATASGIDNASEVISINSVCGVPGCTDPASDNYNPLATVDDGSCLYLCASVTSLTCGTAANYTSAAGTGAWNSLGGPFTTPGIEQLFTYTPTTTANYTISVTSNAYNDLYYSTSCGSTGWTYVDDISGSATNTLALTAGTTYYFLLDPEGTTGVTGTITASCYTPPAWTDAWVSLNTGSSNWCAGETRTISVTVTNTGASTWTDATPDINIGVKWNAETDYFVRTDAGGLAPGATQTYNLTVTAPSTIGTNNLTFDIVNENNFWFADNTNGGGPGNVVYTSPAITINSSPIVIAGNDVTICNGQSATLNGTVLSSSTTSSSPAVAIPDNNPTGVSTTLAVSGAAVTASQITGVTVNITHTWDSDLSLTLIAPDGSSIDLSSGNGGSGDNYTNTYFTTSGTSITLGASPFTGSFTPEVAFSSLTGSANGTWSLRAVDAANGDFGTINSWSIAFGVSAPSATYSWTPSATLSNASIASPIASPTSTTTYTLTGTLNGCSASDAVVVTLPTAGNALSANENATCTVTENGWIHFYSGTGNLVASINSQGQNLGDVTLTSYIDPTNALVPACTNSNPIYATSVMQRHWVITPTIQPTTPVLVRFPFSDAELGSLQLEAFNNANGNDNVDFISDIKLSRYSNGSQANVNGSATDNCGSGTSTLHSQVPNASGTLSSIYPQITSAGQYVTFEIPGFSEFWLHGSSTDSPLPVELVNFQANCAGDGKVAVTWATASEHNSANFTVEKSRDGINWTVLATVAGAGNATQMINYSVDDNTSAAGINYYRLTQTDIDGASETFNIASANCGDNSTTTTVKVYPNPSAGDFYIDFTSEEIIGSSVISITDARGMEVYKMNVTVEKGNNVFHIENMDVAPGMYYIKVSNGTTTSNIVKHSLR